MKFVVEASDWSLGVSVPFLVTSPCRKNRRIGRTNPATFPNSRSSIRQAAQSFAVPEPLNHTGGY